MDCPNCKLVNPPTAERCDCGYSFLSREIDRPVAAAGLEQVAVLYRRLAIAVGVQILFLALVLFLGRPARVGVSLSALVILFQTAALLMNLQSGAHRGRAPSLWLVPLMLLPFVNLLVLLSVDGFVRRLFAKNGVEMGLLGPTEKGLRDLRATAEAVQTRRP